jgi:fibronectin-binding autotransporter adhesin
VNTGMNLSNSFTIAGGAGGNGGSGGGGVTGRAGGAGGAGIKGSAFTLTNTGIVQGGTGGQPGANANGSVFGTFAVGGVGVTGSNLRVINSGAIIGGLGSDGVTRSNAIAFTGGTNQFELAAGWSIIGNAVGVTTGGATNALVLSGSDTRATGIGATVFDAAQIAPAGNTTLQYQGFSTFTKTGASTWQLINNTLAMTPWVIDQGTLSIASDGSLGAPTGTLTFNGGTLETTTTFAMSRPFLLNALGGTVRTDTGTLAHTGAISGGGALIKSGNGTLVLADANSYTGGTDITDGVLQIADDTALGANTGALSIDGGTLRNTASMTMARATTLHTLGGTIETQFGTLTHTGIVEGVGSLTKAGAGTLTLTGSNTYSGGTTIAAGTLQLGNGGTTGAIVGDVTDNGALIFNRSNDLSFGGAISGTGTLAQLGGGATMLSGNSSTFSGSTNVTSGTLLVDGLLGSTGSTMSVSNGGTLGGRGTVGGSVAISDGFLAPGTLPSATPGTLTINGDLSLSGTSGLNYDFGQAGNVGGALNDLTVVGGNLILDGTLNVATAAGGTFGPGLYRVISYGGTLTDNGLVLGTQPPGSTALVQTAVANQVDLVNTAGLTLDFWDGAAAPRNNGAVNGGDGTWQASAGNENWTEASGAINAPYADGTFAIFSAAPGTVTVDNSLGAVVSGGMQFASSGYVVQGGPITLAAGSNLLRVGDGTAPGAGYVASIGSALTGSGGVDKTDLGTLVLSGANSYTGGTTISAGTLQLGNGGSTGAIVGNVTDNGALIFNRSDAVSFGGVISGTGSVTKLAADTLTLTGSNTYSGGTALKGGQITVGHNTALGSGPLIMDEGTTLGFGIDGLSLANAVVLTGTRDPIIDTGAFTETLSGVISGNGALTKNGSGALVLSGTNTYTGATSVSEGTLRAGATNTLSAGSAYTVAAGATLDTQGFNQHVAALTNSGAVSLVSPTAGGTLTMNGSYVGNAGLLRLGTALIGSTSVSDRLVLDGAAAHASGNTTIQIATLDGLGALTTGNGIEVVSGLNGATTTAQTTRDAFNLAGGHVDAGAYEYRLYAADIGGAGENWYLRSTALSGPTEPTPPEQPGQPQPSPPEQMPTYRAEVPLLVALPAQLRQTDLAMLGNLHRRMGDEGQPGTQGQETQTERRRVWGRAVYTDLDIQQPGVAQAKSKGQVSGLQVGADLWADEEWRAGAYVGYLDGSAGVTGNARGFTGSVGRNSVESQYLGAYATWTKASGLYVDGVLQGGSQRYDVRPDTNPNVSGKGRSFTASLEIGKPYALTERWSVEPQAQLIYQSNSLDNMTLTGARVALDAADGWLTRLGVRVKGDIATEVGKLQPYARVNLYQGSFGDDATSFRSPAGGTTLESAAGYSAAEVAAGGTLALTPSTSLYGEIGRMWSIGGETEVNASVQASLGVKVRW